jgi:cell wall-associated NlpC family hydrolase
MVGSTLLGMGLTGCTAPGQTRRGQASMADVMAYSTAPGQYDFSPLGEGQTSGKRPSGTGTVHGKNIHAGSHLSGHSGHQAEPQSHTSTKATEVPSTTASGFMADIQREHRRWIGIPYRSGGTDRRGFDCSGFTMTFFREVLGLPLVHSSKGQLEHNCRHEVEKSDLRCGDLVFFVTSGKKATRGNINHVGIYLSDGQFIHSATRGGVRIDKLSEPYYVRTWVTGGRVFE